MVDAGPPFANADPSAVAGPAGTGEWKAAVHGADAVSAYADACGAGIYAPPQSPLWVKSWAQAIATPPIVATLAHDGEPALALALEIAERGPFRYARFLGGSHANGNFPAHDPARSALLTPGTIRMLTDAVRRARPDIDLLALERLLPALEGMRNPLAALPGRRSANVALAVDLSGGFDTVLGRVNGKRKRKKHRSQLRKFEAAGGFRRIEATTPVEVDRLLGAFFAMRAARFAQTGLPDVFAGRDTRAAFKALFTDALDDAARPFVLNGLEIGGRLRAVTGSSRQRERVVCDFCTFADDELAAASPGDFLFFDNIREACEQKMAVYDFSIGDERYKREWSDVETWQFDLFLPLTARGKVLSLGLSATSGLKRAVKSSPALRRAATALRRGSPAPQPAADD